MTQVIRKAKDHKNMVVIDADTWAESGGTGGIFYVHWKNNNLEIVYSDEKIYKIIQNGKIVYDNC